MDVDFDLLEASEGCFVSLLNTRLRRNSSIGLPNIAKQIDNRILRIAIRASKRPPTSPRRSKTV